MNSTSVKQKASINPDAIKSEGRGVEYKILRKQGDHTARYVYISPGSGGGTFGHALWLIKSDEVVFAKFMPFEKAIKTGNDFVSGGRMPSSVTEECTNEETEISPSESKSAEGDTEFTKENIRTVVRPNGGINPSLYNVNVYVDNYYVIQIFKDCNHCPMFNYMDAVDRAKRYLDILQGWVRG